jgi:hypothetical protein
MKDSASIIISLRGGLGNQMFQFAAALYLAKDFDVKIEWNLGKPSLSLLGKPEINSFVLPDNVQFMKKKRFSWLISKSNGYMLRMQISPRWYEKGCIIKKVISVLASTICYVYFKQKILTVIMEDIGYSEINISAKSTFLNGYFQSSRWVSDPLVLKQMKQLKLLHSSKEVEEFVRLAKDEKPLVVHIRLGDYKFEKDFGILHPDYYRELIESLWASNEFKKIWIFSDEIEIAQKYFQEQQHLNFRFISPSNLSPSATLEIMRHGHAYIIGNSTFSWWAAYLTYSSNAKVIAPIPWFRNINSPKDIIPPYWTTYPSKWVASNDFYF